MVEIPPPPATPMVTEEPVWARELRDTMVGGFSSMNARIDLLVGEGQSMVGRLTAVENRVGQLENARSNSDIRAKQMSSTDEASATAVQSLNNRMTMLEHATAEQTVILQKLERFGANIIDSPRSKLLIGILWTALLGYLTTKGYLSK